MHVSIAYVTYGITPAVVATLSFTLFDEPASPTKVLGIALVTAGVTTLARS